ncbi:hypothetical protein Ddc_21704 [Ditylenchus destructor]|nr:hypothetical protein Ddc_21704 [Ditylenchus destructor]
MYQHISMFRNEYTRAKPNMHRLTGAKQFSTQPWRHRYGDSESEVKIVRVQRVRETFFLVLEQVRTKGGRGPTFDPVRTGRPPLVRTT